MIFCKINFMSGKLLITSVYLQVFMKVSLTNPLHFILVSLVNSLRVQAGAFFRKRKIVLIYDLDEIIIHPKI